MQIQKFRSIFVSEILMTVYLYLLNIIQIIKEQKVLISAT